jgi:hypothetical protein
MVYSIDGEGFSLSAEDLDIHKTLVGGGADGVLCCAASAASGEAANAAEGRTVEAAGGIGGGCSQSQSGSAADKLFGLIALLVATGAASAAGRTAEDEAELTSLALAAGLQGKQLRKHLCEGHRPYSDKCPWCVRANLRERRAVRKVKDSKVSPNGYTIDSDFSGKHEPCIDGYTYAYVGVEVGSGYGYVGLQNSRSATDTVESVKRFESELKQVSGDSSVGIVHHHYDDDKSFRGAVEEYAIAHGWRDTHTGGYRPNANSVVERRIGMLNQVFRCLLLVATGGHVYYEQLWGPGLVHANEVVNARPWPDRDAPVVALSGDVVVKPRSEHVFGEYCIYRVSKEQKSGKWQPNAEMGIWSGHSKDVVGGHIVAPIKWNKSSQVWDIGSTVVAHTIRVWDNVFALRMGPKGGEFGSRVRNLRVSYSVCLNRYCRNS